MKTAEFRPEDWGEPQECQCPREGDKIYHDSNTCTDSVVEALGWYAS